MQTGETAKTSVISKAEQNKWTRKFRLYGAKTDFENKTGITRQTLHRILKEGKGLEANVQAVRDFVNNHLQTA